jgi:hypothetical protein
MERKSLAISVACLVVLAGCAGGLGAIEGESNPTSSSPATATSTPTAAPTATATPTPTPAPTPTPEPWTAPEQPNTPLENKLSQGNRIDSVEVTPGGDSGADANVAFTLHVTANTSMPDIDPAKYGTVKGEPFFLVYANGTIDDSSGKVDVGGTLLERSERLPHREDGSFTLSVKEGALEAANVEGGEVEITVLLMDKDSEWDDIHGMEQLTVTYETNGNASAD